MSGGPRRERAGAAAGPAATVIPGQLEEKSHRHGPARLRKKVQKNRADLGSRGCGSKGLARTRQNNQGRDSRDNHPRVVHIVAQNGTPRPLRAAGRNPWRHRQTNIDPEVDKARFAIYIDGVYIAGFRPVVALELGRPRRGKIEVLGGGRAAARLSGPGTPKAEKGLGRHQLRPKGRPAHMARRLEGKPRSGTKNLRASKKGVLDLPDHDSRLAIKGSRCAYRNATAYPQYHGPGIVVDLPQPFAQPPTTDTARRRTTISAAMLGGRWTGDQ